ncbi:formylglycine-generating enzyme family protein [Candidatus Magnetaquicoccus inordinatus]|uniref:formylglycine-generating enzyme family protein n=1 Tax=Candidatus Magnetaquicoccus inordinatus TaxID=2496818 RepID=UPI00102C0CCC|nr:formylglycine-generating enzyme family protein [Candidatus Magnetaquicoccus inordinatus]
MRLYFSSWIVAVAIAIIPVVLQAADKTFTNSIGMEFVLIPPGSFMMGSEKNSDKNASVSETPRHKVTLRKAFYMGKYEVTQAQWQEVMGNNPSKFPSPHHPVEKVSWTDAQQFIQQLNAREKSTLYRLPTEAEWEYTARAGTTTRFYWGEGEHSIGQYAWYDKNASQQTHPVGQKLPNAWGVYDMAGNVWEWCQDWHHEDYYQKAPEFDPLALEKGTARGRVIRGGSWFANAASTRSADRFADHPSRHDGSLGFRLLRAVE